MIDRRAKRLCLFLGLWLALLLCSCSANIMPGNMTDPLRAPTLNKKQAEVSAALTATLNLAEIVYRYPQSGANRTPFLFRDINGDGSEEAFVFYSFTARPGEVRLKVLSQSEEGQWFSLYDIAGQGDQVEFVDFVQLTSLEGPDLLVGWLNSGRQERFLEMVSLSADNEIVQTQYKYVAYAVADGGQSRLSRLILATQESRGAPFEVKLMGQRNGGFRQMDSLWLYEEVAAVLQMTQGSLWDKSSGIYLDELLDNDTVATEILRLNSEGLELVAGGGEGPESEKMRYYLETFRPDRILSVDINRDGVVEIPKADSLPGIDESDVGTPLVSTVYWRPEEGGLVEAVRAVANSRAGYLMVLPQRWVTDVTVVDYPEANQRSFHILNPRTMLPETELLRIITMNHDSIQQYSGDYILLGERGAVQYYGFLPKATNEPLSLTVGELRELFVLL